MKILTKNNLVYVCNEHIEILEINTRVGNTIFPGINYEIFEIDKNIIPEDFIGHKYNFINGEFVINQDKIKYIEDIEAEKEKKRLEGLEIEKQKKLKGINDLFQSKINNYNSEYTQAEQDRFNDMVKYADIVIAGGEDEFITAEAENRGITPIQFSEVIKTKESAFKTFYITEKIKKNNLINNL